MDLLEYQARDLFEKFDVPVLPGRTATTPEEALAAYAELGADLVVIKAQVRTGGRGKAGGVKLARGEEAVLKTAGAVVSNRGGRTCHAAIVARELGIPAARAGSGRAPWGCAWPPRRRPALRPLCHRCR